MWYEEGCKRFKLFEKGWIWFQIYRHEEWGLWAGLYEWMQEVLPLKGTFVRHILGSSYEQVLSKKGL